MSAIALEAFLARIYTDAPARARFLADPVREAAAAGLDQEQQRALARIDRAGLELAAESFARKRAGKSARKRRWWLLGR